MTKFTHIGFRIMDNEFTLGINLINNEYLFSIQFLCFEIAFFKEESGV